MVSQMCYKHRKTISLTSASKFPRWERNSSKLVASVPANEAARDCMLLSILFLVSFLDPWSVRGVAIAPLSHAQINMLRTCGCSGAISIRGIQSSTSRPANVLAPSGKLTRVSSVSMMI